MTSSPTMLMRLSRRSVATFTVASAVALPAASAEAPLVASLRAAGAASAWIAVGTAGAAVTVAASSVGAAAAGAAGIASVVPAAQAFRRASTVGSFASTGIG